MSLKTIGALFARMCGLEKDPGVCATVVDTSYLEHRWATLNREHLLVGLDTRESPFVGRKLYTTGVESHPNLVVDFGFGTGRRGLIQAPGLDFQFAEFGVYGPKSKVTHSLGTLDYIASSSRYAFGITVPHDEYANPKFRRALTLLAASQVVQVARIWCPRELDLRFESDMVFMLFVVRPKARTKKVVEGTITHWRDANPIVQEFERSDWSGEFRRIWVEIRSSFKSKRRDVQVPRRIFEPPRVVRTYQRPEVQPSIRIAMGGSGGRIRFIWEDPYSKFLFASYKRTVANYLDRTRNDTQVSSLEWASRMRNLVQRPRTLNRLVESLEASGFEVEVDEQVRRTIENAQRRHEIEQAPFEQYVLRQGEGDEEDRWEEINVEDGVRTAHESVYKQRLAEIDRRIDWPLWKFQREDLARLTSKPNAMYAAFMSAGKSRQALSYIQLRGGKKSLIVVESKLIEEFLAEVDKLGISRSDVSVIETPAQCHPDKLKRINLISYSRIWRPVEPDRVVVTTAERPFAGYRPHPKSKRKKGPPSKTIAHLLRRTRFNTVIFDEAQRLKGGMSTKQAKYALLLRAKHFVLMSGTIVKSYPRQIYPLMVRAFGEATTASPWAYNVLIEHPVTPGVVTTGTKVFSEMFVRAEKVSSQFGEDNEIRTREVPMVPEESLDSWYRMIAPRILRRQRHEPLVREDVRTPPGERTEVTYRPSVDHAEFYKWWLVRYAEWFKGEMSDGKKMSAPMVLRQLQLLQFAANIPQSTKLSSLDLPGMPVWDGGLTSKQLGIVKELEEAVGIGQRWIVFSSRPEVLDLLSRELWDRSIQSRVFHGGVTKAKRIERLKEFRRQEEIGVLLMSYDTGNTGYNIPEADGVWLFDYDWVPDKMRQAAARILRAAWMTEEREAAGALPQIRQATQLGTIDEYMRQIVDMKSSGIDQAFDRQHADFDAELWMSYEDFSLQMFRDLGLLSGEEWTL